ncbi:hypothetical protein V2S66_25985 [Streptomyces sp. V4-01]|uniref:Uncharacterized protein n=1 Tax=Actinacidiphila polyblastidii TaxID=3110430 RepID=A0ABU7PHV2_9ACTN|nr:hypothetical protein [Streptomyces sp. V4-01]
MSHARNRTARRTARRTERRAGRARRATATRLTAGQPARRHAGSRGRVRPPGRAAHRRALRREAPVVVGLLLDDQDFAAMTGYRTFPHDDYGRYLRQIDHLLRSLHAQGTHVAVTLFDPEGYADYCQSTRQPPDTPATRTRYVAEATTAGPAVRYARQPLAAVRGDLAREADRRATWEQATDLLVDAGPCPDCGQDLAHCAFDRASHTLLRLIEAVGPGSHHVVCSLPTDGGSSLLAAVQVDAPPPEGHEPRARPGEPGDLSFSEADALVVCTVMAAGAATSRPGGLVVRTVTGQGADRAETVRGWTLRGGEPYPLSEAEVFNAYCTDAVTGEPVPPEPGVRYAAGLPLPPPLPGDTR